MKERHKSYVVIFLVLTRIKENKKEILLQKRQNTGYMDEKYDMACSGHLESNESIITALIREAKEELGIIINSEDVKLVTVVHDYIGNYIRFFFTAHKYKGIPVIKELSKCSQLTWVPIDNLPIETIPHIKSAIKNIENGIMCDDGIL